MIPDPGLLRVASESLEVTNSGWGNGFGRGMLGSISGWQASEAQLEPDQARRGSIQRSPTPKAVDPRRRLAMSSVADEFIPFRISTKISTERSREPSSSSTNVREMRRPKMLWLASRRLPGVSTWTQRWPAEGATGRLGRRQPKAFQRTSRSSRPPRCPKARRPCP